MKDFFSNAWAMIKQNLPGVVKEFPYSTGTLLVIGYLVGWFLPIA